MMRGRKERARSIVFNNVEQIIANLLPGASNSAVRKLTFLRIKAAGSAFVSAFSKETAQSREARMTVQSEWLHEIEKAAADPSYQCQVDARSLWAQEASYLTYVAEGSMQHKAE